MQPFAESTSAALSMIRYVLTDIDDTLAVPCPARTYRATELLHKDGFKVIPVTASSWGWCDLIGHMASAWSRGSCYRCLNQAPNGAPLRSHGKLGRSSQSCARIRPASSAM